MPRVFITGHLRMVGSALVRAIQKNYTAWSLLLQIAISWIYSINPKWKNFCLRKSQISLLMPRQGLERVPFNSYPAEFIHQNLVLNSNLIHSAWKSKFLRFLNLGSSCIYPCKSQQPIKEEYLLAGSLEPQMEAYALAKIAGLEMCRHYRAQYGVLFIVPCQPISMVRGIIIIVKTLMFCLP